MTSRYPGRIIERSERDAGVVAVLQKRLNQRGCGPIDEDGKFGSETAASVALFQARFPDDAGQPLEIDGRVGPVTWLVLFGSPAVPAERRDAPLLAKVLEIAKAEIGVQEEPAGSNRGPRVDQYVRSVGVDPALGVPWCAAFVYWCFEQAAGTLQRRNPLVRTCGVIDHWTRAGRRHVSRLVTADALANPDRIQPGMVFVISSGGGRGHTGLVADVHGGRVVTIEGSTNDGGSREGIGVFKRSTRLISGINRGFIDYASL